ncbi:GNAT family N-acetyltransferase [Pseudofrankia sp. BMG5.37]|uniref:GNAT family N-acetyltransferase n=1 Tax=Pseudofrankia sp. BMG5.37 TaxID=3050035 RepID=UPI00289535A1|nr:GNAT family N-acetyltransferase [Pseudofrankia sp. BMG5.37]MDT3438861.1 GNAT family N-acetyltransferase [Pseudofrankia sp. BMG5.37]
MTHRFEIRTLEKGEWALLRDLRLLALDHDPAAFDSTIAREGAFTESGWLARMDTTTWFVAEARRTHIGLVCGADLSADPPDERHLMSLWVAPPWRRYGVARGLITAVTAWAARDAGRFLSLWVADDNAPAIALFERLGFERTGWEQPFPSDPTRREVRMVRDFARETADEGLG